MSTLCCYVKEVLFANEHSAQLNPMISRQFGGQADFAMLNIRFTLTAYLVAVLLVGASGCSKKASKEADVAKETQNSVIDDNSSHEEMLVRLEQIQELTSENNPYLGSKQFRSLQRQLTLAVDGGNVAREWLALVKLGMAELQLGREVAGIQHLSRAVDLIPRIRDQIGVAREVETLFQLGVGYLRLGESQNCCQRHTPESCILPIRGGGLHVNKEGSTKAIEYFSRVLQTASDTDTRHKQSRWLLNLAYMTLGEYPERVPQEHLIPTASFTSKIEFPRFSNVASALGLDSFDLSGGVILDDFDGDNYLDVFTSCWDTAVESRLFRNDRNGGFLETTEQAGLKDITGGLNLVQADYDNDGDVDVLVLRGAWIGAAGQHPNSLLRNDGSGLFTDVTFIAGLAKVNLPTQTGSWADYDNDGDLDLYVGNETSPGFSAACQLFQNDGDGTFTDVAAKAGVTNDRFTKAVVWGDYNADRFPDIYVSNMGQKNRLYRNNKDGTFTNVAADIGVERPISSFPAWFWDFNNDGNLDIFASSYAGRVQNVSEYYIDQSTTAEPACLYRGNGRGGFTEVGLECNLKAPMLPMGSNFGDLDGDGFLDFYLGTGDPDYSSLVPNLMFLNRGGKRFEDVSMSGGFAHLQKGHGVAFADLDNDGDVEVFEQMGGAYPGDKYPNALYENPGFGNQWICIKLVGTKSNHSAIGARIQVTVNENGETRSIFRHVNSGGSFGANPLRQTIGLGKADSITGIEVFWPTTNQTQIFTDVAMSQFLQIVEGEDQFTTLELAVLQFEKPE